MLNWFGLDFFSPSTVFPQTPTPIIIEPPIPKSSDYVASERIIIVQDGTNFTHNHTFIDANNNSFTIQHTHPYYGEHHHEPHYHSPINDVATSLSSWYQLNMGLIGIGALAVVAIIGSRNFFGNFLSQNYPFGPDRNSYGHEMYDRGVGSGGYNDYDSGYGTFDRESWYEDWYDQWYRDNAAQPFEDEYDYNSYDRENYDRNYDRYYERYKRDLRWNSPIDTLVGFSRNNSTGSLLNYHRLLNINLGQPRVKGEVKAHRLEAHCRFLLACQLSSIRGRQLDKLEMETLMKLKMPGAIALPSRSSSGREVQAIDATHFQQQLSNKRDEIGVQFHESRYKVTDDHSSSQFGGNVEKGSEASVVPERFKVEASTFRNTEEEEEEDDEAQPLKRDYEVAARLGARGNSCHKLHGNCPLNKSLLWQLMKQFRKRHPPQEK